MKPSPLIQRVLLLWEKLSTTTHLSPVEISHKLSIHFRINPIPITLIGQQSLNDTIREDAIEAYYLLMEEDMVRKCVELSISG